MRRWVFNELEVLKPFPQTLHTCGFSPVNKKFCHRKWLDSSLFAKFAWKINISCFSNFDLPVWVRLWRFKRLGRSKALPQTSQGRWLRVDRLFGVTFEAIGAFSELAYGSCSSSESILHFSPSVGGELSGVIGSKTCDNSDKERSSGEST